MREFEKDIAGGIVIADSASLYTKREDGFRGSSGTSSFGSSTMKAILTGWWEQANSGDIMFETTTGNYIDLADGWQKTGFENHSQSQAQDYVNKMIANNKTILQNNLLCARFVSKLNASQRKTLYELQTRLQERNQQLLTDGLVTPQKQSEAYGYNYLNSYLTQFMQTGGVGVVISTTTAIVITAIVVAALSTAAYFAYKALYKESEQDVRYSKELTEILRSKLTEEEYQMLLDETAGIVTKAKIKASLGGATDLIKYALIAAGGYLVYKFITDNSKKE